MHSRLFWNRRGRPMFACRQKGAFRMGQKSNQLFPTFGKLFSRIPDEFYPSCAFWLTEAFVCLLLAEQILRLYFNCSVYIFAYPCFGSLFILFCLLRIGSRLYLDGVGSFSKPTVTEGALLFLLLWCGVATIFSADPMYSLMGSPYRHEGFFTYLIYAAVIFTTRMICSERHRKILLWTLGITGCYLGVFTVLQSEASLRWLLIAIDIHPGRERITAYSAVFSNKNHFAYFLTMTSLALAGITLTSTRKRAVWSALALYAVSLAVMMRNNSLGAIAAVTLGLVFLFILVLIRDKKQYKLCLALLAVHILIFVFLQHGTATIMSDIGGAYGAVKGDASANLSSSIRLSMWTQTIGHIFENPIFGVGLEGGGIISFVDGNDRPHNEYLQYALHTGIPGAVAYLTALFSLFISCIKNFKRLSSNTLILGAMVFGYCVSAFVGNTMYYTTVYFAMLLGMLIGSNSRLLSGSTAS